MIQALNLAGQIASTVTAALAVAYVVIAILAERRVRGTYDRYVLNSVAVGLALGVVIGNIAQLIFDAALGHAAWVVWDIFVLVVWVVLLAVKSDKDDWFHSSWKKLKRWVKRLSFKPAPKRQEAFA